MLLDILYFLQYLFSKTKRQRIKFIREKAPCVFETPSCILSGQYTVVHHHLETGLNPPNAPLHRPWRCLTSWNRSVVFQRAVVSWYLQCSSVRPSCGWWLAFQSCRNKSQSRYPSSHKRPDDVPDCCRTSFSASDNNYVIQMVLIRKEV